MPHLILASNSPRRRQLLTWTGWKFTISSKPVDESAQPGEAPEDYVSRLARAKGEARARLAPHDSLVLAADTIVADSDILLGKPVDAHDAFQMLRSLRGHSHQVYTAIAMLDNVTGKVVHERCISAVPMRNYSDDEIYAYVESGDPLDKAGAYAIQHPGFHPVEDFQGCFASVMGLPLCHLVRGMSRLGWSPPVNIPAACQANLDYCCPVSNDILQGKDAG